MLGALGVELLRSVDALGETPGPSRSSRPTSPSSPPPPPSSGAGARRSLVAGGLSLHMLVVGLTMPAVMASVPMQVVYFVGLFTGVAWARDRRAMLLLVAAVLVLMFGWITWQFAVGQSIEGLLERDGRPLPVQGLFSPVGAYVVYTLLINVLYFGGAVVGGQAAWRAALQRRRLADQAATIDAQSHQLQHRAVIEERMRIARELHDVVAHHVSVIGIQAAAARRVLRRDPEVAQASLRTIETSSREAVTQMRGLLGTLRGSDTPEADARSPEPCLADVPGLTEAAGAGGLDVSCEVVETRSGDVGRVPTSIGLSLYRTVQEALANVRRHSTATAARVVVRVERRADAGFPHGWAEVEVLDDGRPRTGTSGTGLGLLGVRERLSTHGGTSEIGPRLTGGYRVRVRMPLPAEPS